MSDPEETWREFLRRRRAEGTRVAVGVVQGAEIQAAMNAAFDEGWTVERLGAARGPGEVRVRFVRGAAPGVA